MPIFFKHSALIKACAQGNVEEVRSLLQPVRSLIARDRFTSLDVNKPSRRGETAIMAAVENDHAGCLRILLEHGADVNVVDNYGRKPVHIAALRENGLPCLELLLDNNDELKNARDNNDNTPVHYACTSDGKDMYDSNGRRKTMPDKLCLQLLIEREADINAINNIGQTPAHFAAVNYVYNLHCLALLSKGNADLNIRDNKGRTPLYYATEEGYGSSVLLLCRLGAYINVPDNDGNAPLHLAVRNRPFMPVSLISILRKSSFLDIDQKNNKGETACHIAAKSNNDITICLLFIGGAKMDIKDSEDLTPENVANKNNNPLVKRCIKFFADAAVSTTATADAAATIAANVVAGDQDMGHKLHAFSKYDREIDGILGLFEINCVSIHCKEDVVEYIQNEECGICFIRLNKVDRNNETRCYAICTTDTEGFTIVNKKEGNDKKRTDTCCGNIMHYRCWIGWDRITCPFCRKEGTVKGPFTCDNITYITSEEPVSELAAAVSQHEEEEEKEEKKENEAVGGRRRYRSVKNRIKGIQTKKPRSVFSHKRNKRVRKKTRKLRKIKTLTLLKL